MYHLTQNHKFGTSVADKLGDTFV